VDIKSPVLVVEIHLAAQRATPGQISGMMIIERNVLESRFDLRQLESQLDIATRYDPRMIVFCQKEPFGSCVIARHLIIECD
jgi:hypothetical protein